MIVKWDRHLYDGLPEKYHLFSYFLYNEILNLKPFFILATSAGTQLNLPHGVFFIPSGTGHRLVNYIRDKAIDRGRMWFCRAQICE